MSYFLWFLLIIGLGVILGIILWIVIIVGMAIYAFIMATYNTIKYRTWTQEGKDRFKRDHAI